jgi:hypothetical protein
MTYNKNCWNIRYHVLKKKVGIWGMKKEKEKGIKRIKKKAKRKKG